MWSCFFSFSLGPLSHIPLPVITQLLLVFWPSCFPRMMTPVMDDIGPTWIIQGQLCASGSLITSHPHICRGPVAMWRKTSTGSGDEEVDAFGGYYLACYRLSIKWNGLQIDFQAFLLSSNWWNLPPLWPEPLFSSSCVAIWCHCSNLNTIIWGKLKVCVRTLWREV
jgi:hypothetical protein